VTIKELLATTQFGGRSWSGEVIRLAMLKTHYRQPIDWTVSALSEARAELQSWAALFFNNEIALKVRARRARGLPPVPTEEVVSALSDDLNTPRVLAALRIGAANARSDPVQASAFLETLEFLGFLRVDKLFVHNPDHVRRGSILIADDLRLLLDEVQTAFANGDAARQAELAQSLSAQGVSVDVREDGGVSYEVMSGSSGIPSEFIDRQISARLAARKAKNWAESDRIRDELAAMGIQLKDGKNPETGEPITTWEVKR
jgi:cysteinyl-tRNA synthetase